MIPRELLALAPYDDGLTAADALAETLEAAGYELLVLRELHGTCGLAMIYVHHDDAPDEIVLVHPFITGLRQAVDLYQRSCPLPVTSRLATPADVPPYIAAILDPTTPSGQTIDAWTRCVLELGFDLKISLQHSAAYAEQLVGVVEAAVGVRFDLAGGLNTLTAIDAFIVERLRPVPSGEALVDAIRPSVVVTTLALIACHTVERMYRVQSWAAGCRAPLGARPS